MTPICELESFVAKFRYLTCAGYQTSLTVRSENGQTRVSFDVNLGILPPPFSCPPPGVSPTQRRRSPSYFRRLKRRSEERKNSDLYSNVEEVVTEEVTTSKKTEYVPEAVNSTNVFNDESPGAEEVTTPKKAECVSDIESRKAILNEVDVHTNTEKVNVEENAPCSTAEKVEVQDSLDRIDAEIKNQNEKVTPRSIESQDRAPPLPAANVGPSLAPYDQNLSAIANLQNLTMSLELLQSRSFSFTNLS